MTTYEPSTRSTRQLLADWASIMRTLRTRDVVRTNNSPTGDIAEALVARALGGTRGTFSQAGWDIRLPSSPPYPDGERVQVKSLRRVPWSAPTTTCSPIVDQDYDSVVMVVFDEEFRVTEALWLSRAVVERRFRPRKRDGARIISLTQSLRNDDAVMPLEIPDELLGEDAVNAAAS